MNEKDPWEEDRHLLLQVARGDEEAFERVYRETAQRTYFYLLRMLGRKDAAEDVMAETYAQVWKSAGAFWGEARAGTWIIGIARNLAKKILMKTKKDVRLEEVPGLSAGKPETVEHLSRATALARATGRLSADHREVLDLVFYCQLTYPEVSKTLGIPVNTVKTRVFYAKERLKSILEDMGITKNDV